MCGSFKMSVMRCGSCASPRRLHPAPFYAKRWASAPTGRVQRDKWVDLRPLNVSTESLYSFSARAKKTQ